MEVLIDVRRLPTSKVEHFKREALEQWLPEHGIEYVWLGEELGGYPHDGYKAYTKTKLFKERNRKTFRDCEAEKNMYNVFGTKPEILQLPFCISILG